MSQVSYGTITVSDLTDITDVFLQYAKAISSNTITNEYTFSQTGEIGWYTLTTDTSVINNKYYFQLSNGEYKIVLNPTGDPTSQGWYESSTYPTWSSGYQIWIRQITIKEGIGIPEYGTPYLDTAVNQINESVNHIDTLLGGHFSFGSRLSEVTPAGVRIIEQIYKNGIDVSGTPSEWLHNIIIGSNGIQLRYNEAVMAQLAANQENNNTALIFYQPPTISESITTQGKKTMELTGSALNFYGSNQTAPDSFLGLDGLVTNKGIIGGWIINEDSLHTVDKTSWNDGKRGIYIGTYEDEAGNNSFVISGGPNTESQERNRLNEKTPYWFIKDDGSAKFGEMTLSSGGTLSVPAASVSGTLTSSQINVNDLAAISANIGATVGQGSLTNTLGVNIEKEYVLSNDTRVNPIKTYYTKNLDTGEFNEAVYNLTDNDDPSSEYKITDDITLEPGNSIRFERSDNIAIIYPRDGISGLELYNFFNEIINGNFLSVIPTQDSDYEFINHLAVNIYIKNESSGETIFNTDNEPFNIINYTSNRTSSALQVNLNGENVNLTVLLNGENEKVDVSDGFLIGLSQVEVIKNIFNLITEKVNESDNCTFSFGFTYGYKTFPRYKQYYRKHSSTRYEPIDSVVGEFNPHDNNYYEIEPWYEKIDSSYITLESHKNIYILSNDEEVQAETNYYEYTIEYGLTSDVEKKENKDYYISNNKNTYELTNDVEVITEIINNKEKLKKYFIIQRTSDETFLENKDYCTEINGIYTVITTNQKNQSPAILKYYEAIEIEGLKEHDIIEDNWYEAKYKSSYIKVDNNKVINPMVEGLFEQIISYQPVVKSINDNPKELNWYVIDNQYDVQLKLQNAQMNISSNDTNLFTIKSEEENDINITNMEITDKLRFGNIELISFDNGLAIQARGN